MIGHTQPRRLAARTVAERIAEELGVDARRRGRLRGPLHRPGRASDTLVKLMTDGILLAEIQRDRMLRALRHDHHRRGARAQPQHRLPARLPQAAAAPPARPQADHHVGDDRPAALRRALRRRAGRRGVRPHLPGRGPLPARRRPGRRATTTTATRSTAIVRRRRRAAARRRPATCSCSSPASARSATRRRARSGHRRRPAPPRASRASTEVLPLYARLSAAEQHRVFAAARRTPGRAGHQRRRDLADRARIRYVVDPGTARISRYSHRLKVQRLPIEPSRRPRPTSARAAAGARRDGICIRLYAEEDFDARPEFTEPEILRTNLASVILQMTALGLGDIAAFPFLDPPDRRQVRDGVALLDELGALDPASRPAQAAHPARPPARPAAGRPAAGPDGARGRPQRLRPRGAGHRRRAVDPGPARAAGRTSSRPPTSSTAASPTTARTSSPTCNLWRYLHEQQKALSVAARSAGCAAPSSCTTCGSASGRTCTASCARSPSQLGIGVTGEPPSPATTRSAVHTVAAGRAALAHRPAGRRTKREYLGARGARSRSCPGRRWPRSRRAG